MKDFIASAIAQKRWVYAVPKSSMDDWKDSFIFAFFGGDNTLNMDSVVNRIQAIQAKNPGIQVFSVPQESETLDGADFYSADKELTKELEKVGFDVSDWATGHIFEQINDLRAVAALVDFRGEGADARDFNRTENGD